MKTFSQQLAEQRWDDHRYYHHSRVNQSLHLFSAISFLVAYAMLAVDPAIAALIGWLISMSSRQIGHFFFEPTGYDEINQATQEYKEAIKVGYNLHRKIILIALWLMSPLLLCADPTLLGLVPQAADATGLLRNIGMLWLFLAVAGLLFRTFHLVLLKGPMCAMVWLTKILTDPWNDIRQYHKAPLFLMRGEMIEAGPRINRH